MHTRIASTLFFYLSITYLIYVFYLKTRSIDVRFKKVQKRRHPEGKASMERDKMDLMLPLKAPSEERTTNMNWNKSNYFWG